MASSAGRIALIAWILAAAAPAAPVISEPLNQASFVTPEFRQFGVAQGAMFAVFGIDMGPDELVQASAFPLPTELAGTSVQAAVDGVTVDCFLVFTSAGQLAAILPSETPVGEGLLTVTYNGETSEPARLLVREHGIGVFSIRQDGQGPGVITDAAFQIRELVDSFTPGQRAIAWVTGLGARARDDVSEPEDLRDGFDLEVFVGDRPAETYYAGPSGCCGAVDVVHFDIPPDVPTGCFVPVVMRIGDSVSNFTTLPVASDGGTCSDPHAFFADQIERMRDEGELVVGALAVNSVAFEERTAGAIPPTPLKPQPPEVAGPSAEPSYSGQGSLTWRRFAYRNHWYDASTPPLGTWLAVNRSRRAGANPFAPETLPVQGDGLATLRLLDGSGLQAPLSASPDGKALTIPLIPPSIWSNVDFIEATINDLRFGEEDNVTPRVVLSAEAGTDVTRGSLFSSDFSYFYDNIPFQTIPEDDIVVEFLNLAPDRTGQLTVTLEGLSPEGVSQMTITGFTAPGESRLTIPGYTWANAPANAFSLRTQWIARTFPTDSSAIAQPDVPGSDKTLGFTDKNLFTVTRPDFGELLHFKVSLTARFNSDVLGSGTGLCNDWGCRMTFDLDRRATPATAVSIDDDEDAEDEVVQVTGVRLTDLSFLDVELTPAQVQANRNFEEALRAIQNDSAVVRVETPMGVLEGQTVRTGVPCDLDDDGKADSTDLALFEAFLDGFPDLPAEADDVRDVDGDGRVNQADFENCRLRLGL